MATKVFISWSGELSRKLAETVREWLPGALQFVRPYFTPEDIEKGARWGSDIVQELESSDIGIVCLTHANTDSPWILFEAGALS
ncbi:MAG: toll/interleukin-1 receptor domain-containing protein, partial [Verrucomicrobiae bacterium]|nr:toll/interleukin-1 receptor domain-containing protein [Verrucomicrobiae bacterium]